MYRCKYTHILAIDFTPLEQVVENSVIPSIANINTTVTTAVSNSSNSETTVASETTCTNNITTDDMSESTDDFSNQQNSTQLIYVTRTESVHKASNNIKTSSSSDTTTTTTTDTTIDTAINTATTTFAINTVTTDTAIGVNDDKPVPMPRRKKYYTVGSLKSNKGFQGRNPVEPNFLLPDSLTKDLSSDFPLKPQPKPRKSRAVTIMESNPISCATSLDSTTSGTGKVMHIGIHTYIPIHTYVTGPAKINHVSAKKSLIFFVSAVS